MKRIKLFLLAIITVSISCGCQGSISNTPFQSSVEYNSDFYDVIQTPESFDDQEDETKETSIVSAVTSESLQEISSESEFTWETETYIDDSGKERIVNILPPREEMLIPDSVDDDFSKYFPDTDGFNRNYAFWGSATLYRSGGAPVWGIDEFIKFNRIESVKKDINFIPEKWRDDVERIWEWEERYKDNHYPPVTKLFLIEGYSVIKPFLQSPFYMKESDFNILQDKPKYATVRDETTYYFFTEYNVVEFKLEDLGFTCFLKVKDNVLYYYANRLDRERFFGGIRLDTGEKIYNYSEKGGMMGVGRRKPSECYESNIPGVNNSYDLYEFMLDISDIWYRI